MADINNIIVHGDSRLYTPELHTPINMVLTDPPFGMAFESNRAITPQGKEFTKPIEGDGNIMEALELFWSVMGPIIPKLADEAELYIFTAWHILDYWIPAVKDLAFIHPDGSHDPDNGWQFDYKKGEVVLRDPKGFDNGIRLKMMLLWDKGYPGQGDLTANWGCGHEVILYLKKGRRPIPRRRSGIIHVDGNIDEEIAAAEAHVEYLKAIKAGTIRPNEVDLGIVHVNKLGAGQNIHPTEKPVELLKRLIEMSTNEGDFIIDPFSGSGSTSVAAKELRRNSLAFEIDERYIARSQDRLKGGGLFD